MQQSLCSGCRGGLLNYKKQRHASQRTQWLVQCSSSFNGNDATINRGGPAGAFTAGNEAAARQQLFNRIAPIYDQVCCRDVEVYSAPCL